MAEDNATNNIKTNVDESELVITRVFDAPRELVFKAWTESECLQHWWGPKGFTMSVSKFRSQSGRNFSLQSENP
jgi:uncharacterized protein YndB with AHSA1/START domain